MARVRKIWLAPAATVLVVAVLVAHGARSPVALVPELAWAAPSWQWPLGCGEGGVDLLALASHAVVRASALALVVALLGCAIGTPLGAYAAFARGMTERVVARASDSVQAFPSFLLAIAALSSVRFPSRVHLALVFATTAWAPFAKLALAQARVLRSSTFVDAARALGAGNARLILKHLVPNMTGLVAVQLGSTAAAVVVSEAGLAFVGFGARDGVSLGGILDQGVAAMQRAPHVLCVGSLSVFALSLSLMVAGRALDSNQR